jgi:hypothetical protein
MHGNIFTMPDPENDQIASPGPAGAGMGTGTGMGMGMGMGTAAGESNVTPPAPQRPVRAVLVLFVVAIVLLPLAFLLTLREIDSRQMRLGAEEIARIVTGIRGDHATHVVERLQASGGQAVLSERCKEVHGGIPIPATPEMERVPVQILAAGLGA